MKTEWDIKKRSSTCFITKTEFEEGDIFYTLLYRETEGFRREDLCEEAWNDTFGTLTTAPLHQQPFSFWKSRYELPPPVSSPEPLNKEDGENVLRHLIAQNNPAHTNFIYILALLLERKRLLRPIEGEDPDTLVYEHSQTGEVFLIRNPHLSLSQIPVIQREVSEFFHLFQNCTA